MRHHILRALAAFVIAAVILAVGGALSWVTYHLTAANVALAASFVVLAGVAALSLAALLWLILAPPLKLLDRRKNARTASTWNTALNAATRTAGMNKRPCRTERIVRRLAPVLLDLWLALAVVEHAVRWRREEKH